MAESYARLYPLSLVGLRFFTVYGLWGRPDMAYWMFTDAILRGETIRLFNKGDMRRDFTDVRDVVEAMLRIIDGVPRPGHEIYNVGHSDPVSLRAFVEAIEAAAGRSARIDLAPMQPGDVQETFADVTKLERAYGFSPRIDVRDGMADFVRWFRSYRGL
jgi:UDP-glucuronate 4-epimerase